MAVPSKVIIKIAIPERGSPSVFETMVQTSDSAGPIKRSMSRSERLLVARALISFLGHLIE